MIECVLFDLDGVLVDACDWHYESLNNALIKFGYNPIERSVHLQKFNGLPTHIKLNMLNIDSETSNKINKLKQEITLEIIECNANIMNEKIELHKFLKKQNIKIGCVTNSIKKTAEKMLHATGQLEYMDIIISNEDVLKNKPDPECYNLAVKKLKVNQLKTICVEDSEKGIQAAISSIVKHLIIVKNTKEVNLTNIKSYLESIQ